MPTDSRSLQSRVLAVLALLGAALPARAQFPWTNPATGAQQGQGQGQPTQPQQQVPNPGIYVPSFKPNRDPDNLSSQWIQPMSGFPTYPAGLGAYPPPPGWGRPPSLFGVTMPSAIPTKPGWPSWVQTKDGPPLPYEAEKVVLVRQADRVWIQKQGDDVFVPLYHWDTARSLAAGDRVRVEQTGEFLLMFYGGGRLDTFGPTDITIDALADLEARITVHTFTRMRLAAATRSLYLNLPDGSVLATLPPEKKAPAAGAPDAAAEQEVMLPSVMPTEVYFDRADELGDAIGRATIFNGGDRPVRWLSPASEVMVEPGRRVTMLMTPPRAAVPAALVEDGVRAEAAGPVRRWLALAPGAVGWSGAKFVLPQGASLQIDPMLGDPFGLQQFQSKTKDSK